MNVRRFEIGDYVIISKPVKTNQSFILNDLAELHEGRLGRIYKIKDILDMQCCSIRMDDRTLTAYADYEIRLATDEEIKEINISDLLPKDRGFEVVDDEFRKHPDVDIKLPKRGTSKSAGYDICTPVKIVVPLFGSFISTSGC